MLRSTSLYTIKALQLTTQYYRSIVLNLGITLFKFPLTSLQIMLFCLGEIRLSIVNRYSQFFFSSERLRDFGLRGESDSSKMCITYYFRIVKFLLDSKSLLQIEFPLLASSEESSIILELLNCELITFFFLCAIFTKLHGVIA